MNDVFGAREPRVIAKCLEETLQEEVLSACFCMKDGKAGYVCIYISFFVSIRTSAGLV